MLGRLLLLNVDDIDESKGLAAGVVDRD